MVIIRLSKEYLTGRFPSWNDKQDIVKVMYGDEPLYIVDRVVETDNSTINNIFGVQNYIFTRNGKYAKYRTLIGEIAINAEGNVLYGELGIKYRRKMHRVFLTNMYGRRILKIICVYHGGHIKGWSNFKIISLSGFLKLNDELPIKTVNKLFQQKDLKDYGESVQKFVAECSSIVEESDNHFLDELYS